jgi:ATP-dependent helicase/nuclease subunit A
VLERLRQRLQLLLVDEFQDTDPVQSEIVRRLSLEGDPADCPSLFVVGDPKQSIYGWRDADLGAYEAFQEVLESRGGQRFHLAINFRSTQEVLDEVERVVAPVMHMKPGVQPPFQSLEAAHMPKGAKPFRSGNWWEVEYWVSWRPDPSGSGLSQGNNAETQRIEAKALAEDIFQLHSQAGVAWNDIGILFRKTMAQPVFLEELRRRGVPFAVTRDRNYYQRREVIEVAAWLRTIINPADHLALLTVLRSVTIGVPDAALIPLWSQAFPKLVTELEAPDTQHLGEIEQVVNKAAASLPEGIPGIERIAGWERPLIAAMAGLARLRLSYREDPADIFVGNVRRELLIEAFEAARFQGRFRLANLNRFFRQLEAALESEDSDVHAILRALRLGVLEAREAEEAMPRDAVEDAVQVMTIHTAKGLEFRHIYLVQMHSGTRSGGNDLLEAREISPGDWEYQLFKAPTLSFQRAAAKIHNIEVAEAVRTLYVALTRACERLVLIGRWPETPAPVPAEGAGNYIDLVQNRSGLPLSIATLANDPANQLLGFHDQDKIRWRFLGNAQLIGASRKKESPATWILSAEALREHGAQRKQRAQEAQARMGRRLVQPATAGVSERIEATGLVEGELQDRGEALSIGTALHRALETWDLEAPPAEELERQRELLPRYFPAQPSAETLEETGERLEGIAEGALLERLTKLREQIVGREVPVVLASSGAESDPVGAITGAIDLLYRDPESGQLVIADFKSDRIGPGPALEHRANAYAVQEQRYAKAVRIALELNHTPRTELWWLWLDLVTDAEGAAL